MSETLRNLEACRNAILYMLGQVQTNPDLRHIMLGTQAFALLIEAESESAGVPAEEVRRHYEEDRQPTHRRYLPNVLRLEKRVLDLERLLDSNGIPLPEWPSRLR